MSPYIHASVKLVRLAGILALALIAGFAYSAPPGPPGVSQDVTTGQIASLEAMLAKYYLKESIEGERPPAPSMTSLSPLHFHTDRSDVVVSIREGEGWIAPCFVVSFSILEFTEVISAFKQKGYVQSHSDCATLKSYSQSLTNSGNAYFLKYFKTDSFVMPSYLPMAFSSDFTLKSKSASVLLSKKTGLKTISLIAPSVPAESISCVESYEGATHKHLIAQSICNELPPVERDLAVITIETSFEVSGINIPAYIGGVDTTCNTLLPEAECSVTVTSLTTAASYQFFPLRGDISKKLTGTYLTLSAEAVVESKKLLIGFNLVP